MARMRGADGVDGVGGADAGADADEWGELEIEVTDLRTGATIDQPALRMPWERPFNGTGGTIAPEEADVDEDDATLDAAPGSVRLPAALSSARTVRGAVVAGAVVLVLVGLLLSNPGVSGTIHGGLFPPTPTIASGSNVIWFRHAVPWGKVEIDGRVVQETDQYTPTSLRPGRHTLIYQAPPFATLRCTVSAPAAPSDTCVQDVNLQNEQDPPPDGERAIDLGAIPDKLPAASRTALVDAVQSLLDTLTSTAQVAPGDHYGTQDGKVRVATRPITMTLAFVVAPPDPAAATASYNGEDCNPLCVVPNGPYDTSLDWPLSALVIPQWRYTGDDGTAQVVTAPAPVTVRTIGGFSGNLLTFSVQWANGSWQVTLANLGGSGQMAMQACAAAMQVLPPMSTSNGENGFGISYGPGSVATQMANGCAITVTPMDTNSTPTGKPALVLLRFGALIAANGAAHRLYPMLPTASGREAALARQLGSTPQG